MKAQNNNLDQAKALFEIGRKGTLWTPRNKIIAALALVYFISPIDLVPDIAIPLVGWLDDLGIIAAAAAWIATHRGAVPAPKKEQLPGEEQPGEASSLPNDSSRQA